MKELIKEKYSILIPIFLIIVVIIALILYGREYKNNRYAITKEDKVYQYFSGIKMEYTAKVSRNRKNVILNFESKDSVVNLDSTPIYYKKKNKVIFPKEMIAVFPIKDKLYKVNALAEVYKKNDLYYLNQKNVNDTFDYIFYFDGKNTYFFNDPVTLKVGEKEIELSSMSYVNCSYQNLLEYYDKESDTFEKISLKNEIVTASNKYMTIDVTLDKVIYKDSFTILTSDLSSLEKISDMNNKK